MIKIIRKHPLLTRFILILVAPAFFTSIYVNNYFIKSAEHQNETLILKNIGGEITIEISEKGIPAIKAESDADAYFAMGYMHASDRLWQLEILRRTSRGELSEIFGESTLHSDIFHRTLSLIKYSQMEYNNLSDGARESLESYASGINAYIKRVEAYPPEFHYFDLLPGEWTPIDSIAVTKLFALALSSNYYREYKNTVAERFLTEDLNRFLFSYSVGLDKNSIEISSALFSGGMQRNVLAPQSFFSSFLGDATTQAGSNAWVVSGKYTRSGYPIITADPHMKLSLPSPWYGVSIESPQVKTIGLSVVGLPLVLTGRNENIGWAITNMMADTQDIYYEKLGGPKGEYYYDDNEWKKLDIRYEDITVRAKFPEQLRPKNDPVKIVVRETSRGPLIDYFFGNNQSDAISLKWVALTSSDTSYEAFYQLSYASSWVQFRAALSKLVSPALNFMYADVDGNIGYSAAGSIPLRGENSANRIKPGWNDEYSWKGVVEFSQLPKIYNPKEGYIVNANNSISNGEYYITHDWAKPFRYERISTLIQKHIDTKTLIDRASMMEIQNDTIDLSLKNIIPQLVSIDVQDKRHKELIQIIRNWDMNVTGESIAPTIVFAWLHHLKYRLLLDEVDIPWTEKQHRKIFGEFIMELEGDDIFNIITYKNGMFCDNKITKEIIEECDSIVLDSLKEAIKDLDKMYGTNLDNWKWRDTAKQVYFHIPFSRSKLLENVFGKKDDGVGSNNTIQLYRYFYSDITGFQSQYGVSHRQFIDISPLESANYWFLLPGGQSGNLFSEQYYGPSTFNLNEGLIKESKDIEPTVLKILPVEAVDREI